MSLFVTGLNGFQKPDHLVRLGGANVLEQTIDPGLMGYSQV